MISVTARDSPRPIGVYSMGYEGIYVYDIEHGVTDRVTYRFSTEDKMRRARIHYETATPYFRTPIGRIKVEEVMRI